jgi:hypothetical protein
MSNKRTKTKYPGLNKKVNTKVRQELIDYDYLNKLSPEEKEWLNKFSEEYNSASFKKSKKGNYSTKNLHRTKKLRKECYDRNNSRNRDIFSITKANDMLKEADKLNTYLEEKSIRNATQVEDDIIAIIDFKNESESSD